MCQYIWKSLVCKCCWLPTQHQNPKFNDTTSYLHLKKNLYGCKQVARNWFRIFSEGLRKEGFTQSKTDSCLFPRSDGIIIVYVDDCLFFSPDSTTMDTIINFLSKSFKLKDEGDISAFLGVKISKNTQTKTIQFTQPGLIDQILCDANITLLSIGKVTPCNSILHPDPDGPSHAETWNYHHWQIKLPCQQHSSWH